VDGYRLSAIRRGSPLDELGIRNGDIVHDVNGQKVDSVAGVLEAQARIRRAERLEIGITRRNEPMVLQYTVGDCGDAD
jgi:S1-C subfamily serine protease